jgi:hypothetical protein
VLEISGAAIVGIDAFINPAPLTQPGFLATRGPDARQ